jgi:hypothetical protein
VRGVHGVGIVAGPHSAILATISTGSTVCKTAGHADIGTVGVARSQPRSRRSAIDAGARRRRRRLELELLFEDHLVVAAGIQSKWARRRRIDLAELADQPWILTPSDTWNSAILAEAFRMRGLDLPKPW